MKKFLSFLIVLALGAYAGAAYMFGGQAREQYFSAVKEYERYGFLSLSNQRYERGFFTSTAQTLVELKVPGTLTDSNDDEILRFVVGHVLHHGPLTGEGGNFFSKPGIMRITSTVEPLTAEGVGQTLFTRLPELAQTTSEVRVGFGGEVSGDVLIPAIDRDMDGEHVTWGGLALKGEYLPMTRALRGELAMPGLALKTTDGNMELEALSSNFDMIEALPFVYTGQATVGVSAMNITPAEGDAITVRDLRISSNSSCDGALYHCSQVVGLESVDVGGTAYGPASCELTGRNIDAAALSEFQAGLRQLYHTMADTESEMFFDRVGELYAAFFAKMLTGTPELNMPHLRVATPMGDFTGAFSLKLLAPGAEAALNPLMLLQHLEAAAQMAVHEELLKGLLRIALENEQIEGDLDTLVQQRYAEQIEPLLARNLIVREDGIIKAQAMFVSGKLTVNGQDMPIF